MRYFEMFLASSICEFKSQRVDIGDFIQSLNNVLVKHDIYISCVKCEYFSNNVAPKGKQEEYNQYIREKREYVCIILGQSIGDYTLLEFKVAEEQFKKRGIPHTCVCFLQTACNNEDKSITDFKAYLQDNDYSYKECNHIDEVKYTIVRNLISLLDKKELLQVKEGQVLLDNKVILETKNILFI